MGIGAATAKKLCELGASLGLDRNVEALKALVAELTSAGYRAIPILCDLASESEVEGAVASTVQHSVLSDVTVSNAGIQRYGDITHTSTRVWDETFRCAREGLLYSHATASPRCWPRAEAPS